MKTSATLLLALVASALAQITTPQGEPIAGFQSPASFSSAGNIAAAAAGRNPDATDSVTFKSTILDKTYEYTWRVNITELVLPNNYDDYGKSGSQDYSDKLRQVNTQWQLEWPQTSGNSNKSLQTFYRDNDQLLMVVEAGYNYAPTSLTDKWTNPSDGDCSSIYGSDCVQELELLPTQKNPGSGLSSQCKKTLNKAMGSGFLSSSQIYPKGSNANGQFYSDNTLFFTSSSPYKAGNNTELEYAKSTLQMLTFYFQNQKGQYSNATVRCQIVCKDCEHADPSSAAPRSVRASMAWGLFVAVAVLLVAC